MFNTSLWLLELQISLYPHVIGYTLTHFGLESVMISNYGRIIMKYLSFQFQMNKTDAFEEFFCLRSNQSNTLFSRMVICPSNLVFE